jgi:EPS-associated MarR family transcriptional regulator
MTEQTKLKILQFIQSQPDMTQRDMAQQAGVSLGQVNYVMQALREKGLVKLENFSKNPNKLQYAYLLTPQGLLEKAQLTVYFLQRKRSEFEALKQEIADLEKQVPKDGAFLEKRTGRQSDSDI